MIWCVIAYVALAIIFFMIGCCVGYNQYSVQMKEEIKQVRETHEAFLDSLAMANKSKLEAKEILESLKKEKSKMDGKQE